jgi:hypothetical protein
MYRAPVFTANPIHSLTLRASWYPLRWILRLLNQQQVARMYDVFDHWIWSSRCYLAAFIAKTDPQPGSYTVSLSGLFLINSKKHTVSPSHLIWHFLTIHTHVGEVVLLSPPRKRTEIPRWVSVCELSSDNTHHEDRLLSHCPPKTSRIGAMSSLCDMIT